MTSEIRLSSDIINANHYLPLDSLYVSKYCKCKQLFYKHRLGKKNKISN